MRYPGCIHAYPGRRPAASCAQARRCAPYPGVSTHLESYAGAQAREGYRGALIVDSAWAQRMGWSGFCPDTLTTGAQRIAAKSLLRSRPPGYHADTGRLPHGYGPAGALKPPSTASELQRTWLPPFRPCWPTLRRSRRRPPPSQLALRRPTVRLAKVPEWQTRAASLSPAFGTSRRCRAVDGRVNANHYPLTVFREGNFPCSHP